MANRKLRSATETQKISKSKPNISATCLNDNKSPVFSFAHVTSNKNYCFDFFNNNRDNLECRKALDELLALLSNSAWKELSGRRKAIAGGFETLYFDFLNFQPQNIALKKDEKIFVFRFGKGDAYRLMGFKKECNCTLYIIGYDFDHSAYDH